MKPRVFLSRIFSFCAFLTLASLLSSCLVSPVGSGGGIGATTVKNSSPDAIIAAANDAFAGAGYTLGPVDYPYSVSYDKPAGGFGQLTYGSYGQTTSYRAKLGITPVPGTQDYRIGVSVFRVNDAGQMGFEDSTRMMGLWSAEFAPLMKQIRQQASGE